MMSILVRTGKIAGLSVLLLSLMACSGSPERKGVYEKDRDDKPLEIPPELSTPKINEALSIPIIAPDKSTYSAYNNVTSKGTSSLLPKAGDARFVRDGNMHWLEINAEVEKLWLQLRDFIRETGFEIKFEQPGLGIVETNWLENRADVPTNWFSKLLNKLYSTGLMDKYRIRVERAENNTTRVFISHRGLKQKVAEGSTADVIETVWETRPSDPELEVEMLQRFLVYRGTDENVAEALTASRPRQERTVLQQVEDNYALQVNENFPRTWRRVGLALDRLGLLVEDRNRSQGVYYIQLSEEFRNKEKQGWFAKLFSGSNKEMEKDLLLKLNDQGAHTLVTVHNRKGALINAEAGQQILSQLQDYLR